VPLDIRGRKIALQGNLKIRPRFVSDGDWAKSFFLKGDRSVFSRAAQEHVGRSPLPEAKNP